MSDGPPFLNLAAISLGSNILPLENLPQAVRDLQTFGKIAKVSRVYESAPVGFLDQASFLNAAVLLETSLSAEELKSSVLKSLERKLGRVRDPHNKNAPRTIDLDLSLFVTPTGSRVLDDEFLTRAFVAVPLAEILPSIVHPQTGQTLSEIAQSLASSSPGLLPRPDCDLSACLSPVL
jgi:2-amino-4-hydroxy-6-hydroxymethyldihydropteridine diphosphokinase